MASASCRTIRSAKRRCWSGSARVPVLYASQRQHTLEAVAGIVEHGMTPIDLRRIARSWKKRS